MKVKESAEVRGKCQCHVIVMILIIHVGEHGSQNTIVHVKSLQFLKISLHEKMYTEKINNNENLIEFLAFARSTLSRIHTIKRIKK